MIQANYAQRMEDLALGDSSRQCLVCHDFSGPKGYCPRCASLLRPSQRKGNRQARLEAMHDQLDEDRHAFICKYTKTALTHTGGARDAEWEHRTPGDPMSVVLVAALVNRMKADLTEAQWDAMIRALYETRIEGMPFDEKVFPSNWQPRSTAWQRGQGRPGWRAGLLQPS
jgi:hypothetical protein